MFKHFKEIFGKKEKTLPTMTNIQRMVVTYTQGFIGRKSRSYYLKSHDCQSLEFISQDVKNALRRLQVQKKGIIK
jgi:hypothetical protein